MYTDDMAPETWRTLLTILTTVRVSTLQTEAGSLRER